MTRHYTRGTDAERNTQDMLRKGRARGWPKGVPMGPRKRAIREQRQREQRSA